MKTCLVTAAILLVAAFATAANIDGTWAGKFDSGMGGPPMELDYIFKADGSKLTGTTTGGAGAERIPIKNGKIDGNNISFTVETAGEMPMTLNFKGVLSGDELKLSFDMGMGGPPSEFTVKRVK
ncbi:MAG TPA: hypothetical protein VLL97_07305 [Acidobacteriota bacterium]|nr:hypothetical protein [Acidobacteriota bacterium]